MFEHSIQTFYLNKIVNGLSNKPKHLLLKSFSRRKKRASKKSVFTGNIIRPKLEE